MRTASFGLALALVLGTAACAEEPEDPSASASPSGAGQTPDAGRQPERPAEQNTNQAPVTTRSQEELDAALIDAAWDDDLPRARALIRQGADVNARDDSMQSAHLIAASEGYLGLLRLTFEHGAKVKVHDSFDGTGLIRAAERGHDLVVGRLLQSPTPVDHVNNLGWTALHEAIALGEGTPDYQATVRALIAGGADLRTPTERNGRTPLQLAQDAGQEQVAEILATALDSPAPQDPDAALLAAAERGDADAAAVALRAGADPETRDEARRTALLLAVTGDHLEVARLLAALGADPDAVDGQRDTPWLVTGVTGSVPMAELLLEFGPDLTARNRYGGISVIPASERGHVDYVRLMTTTRTDLDHVNDLGWTALLEAVILGDGGSDHQRIVRILLDAGADRTILDRDGVTALQHAERSGYREIAALLRG